MAYRAPLSLLEEYGLSNDFDGKRTHMLHIASAGVIDVQTTRNTNTSKGRVIHRLKGTQKSFQIFTFYATIDNFIIFFCLYIFKQNLCVRANIAKKFNLCPTQYFES